MLVQARKQLRSWMFIYAGLVALGQPVAFFYGLSADTRLEATKLPVNAEAPLLRRDI